MRGSEDSTGKSKAFEAKRSYQNLIAFFLIGLCVGIVIAERIYVQRSKSGDGLQSSARQLSVQTGSGKVTLPNREAASEDNALAVDFSKPARNDLEELLRKVCLSCGAPRSHDTSCRPCHAHITCKV